MSKKTSQMMLFVLILWLSACQSVPSVGQGKIYCPVSSNASYRNEIYVFTGTTVLTPYEDGWRGKLTLDDGSQVILDRIKQAELTRLERVFGQIVEVEVVYNLPNKGDWIISPKTEPMSCDELTFMYFLWVDVKIQPEKAVAFDLQELRSDGIWTMTPTGVASAYQDYFTWEFVGPTDEVFTPTTLSEAVLSGITARYPMSQMSCNFTPFLTDQQLLNDAHRYCSAGAELMRTMAERGVWGVQPELAVVENQSTLLRGWLTGTIEPISLGGYSIGGFGAVAGSGGGGEIEGGFQEEVQHRLDLFIFRASP